MKPEHKQVLEFISKWGQIPFEELETRYNELNHEEKFAYMNELKRKLKQLRKRVLSEIKQKDLGVGWQPVK